MRDPEYDRFGPWAIEISEEDPPPPLFVPYLTRDEEPLLSVKIPRNIERRNAHPGMNLYDYLVLLYEDDLVILQRVDADVRQDRVVYRDIQFIRYGENLLKGTLHLSTAVSAYDLPFNTTSKDIMRRLVVLIRERNIPEGAVIQPRTAHDVPTGELSYFFTRLLATEEEHAPDLRLLAAQPDTSIGSAEKGILRKLLLGAISKTLMESFHVSEGRELRVTTRSRTFKYRWQTEYGAEYTFMPLYNISSYSWRDDAQNTAVIYLDLQTKGETLSFAFVRDNPWIAGYDRFLTAVSEGKLNTEI